ncbi:hypothetical protein RKE29_19105, partial [Streptomyces sp. B1866]|nr:hypothetical protein [Streptomyces sp. B1866]
MVTVGVAKQAGQSGSGRTEPESGRAAPAGEPPHARLATPQDAWRPERPGSPPRPAAAGPARWTAVVAPGVLAAAAG